MKAATKKQPLKRGDYVREIDGTKIGIVILLLEQDPDLVIVSWPPSREGFCYHVDDLVRV